MKRIIKITALLITSIAFTSCATLFTGKTTEVVLVNPPSDLKVSEAGQELKLERVIADVKTKGANSYSHVTTITTFYASGVMVNKKIKKHTLTLESAGKKVDAILKSKVHGGLLFLDIIFFPIPAIPIDAATKKWRVIRNKYVDVPAVLAGTESKSQRQLKKLIKKQAEQK
ncbi:MAG: hypothetical protein HYX39_00780 [Bacteroidetes bacterium]|nr:hypothetical protein [Bacteroidota bacterium]